MRATTALLLALAASGCRASTSGVPVVVPPPGQLVFYDDFTGDQLDRARWTVRTTGGIVNNEQQAYVDSAATLYIAHGGEAEGADDGALVIRALRRPGFVTPQGTHLDFISGRIDTRGKTEFTYGTAAARMKLPAGAGLWPAFWLLGTGDWPATGEIDVMESVGDSEWTSVALHGPGYSGQTPLVNRYYFAPGRGISTWHVYSVDWSPTEITFRVDDAVVYRVTRAMVEHFGRWAFDNPKYLILNFALGGAYPQAVNGVTAPYPGIPDSTVAMIERGDAKVLVDWVRVWRR